MIVMICHNRATVTHCSSEKRCTGAFTPALPPASMSSPLNIIIIISMSTPCIVVKGFSLYCSVSLFIQIFPLMGVSHSSSQCLYFRVYPHPNHFYNSDKGDLISLHLLSLNCASCLMDKRQTNKKKDLFRFWRDLYMGWRDFFSQQAGELEMSRQTKICVLLRSRCRMWGIY